MLIDKLASGALRLDGHTTGTRRLTNWKKMGLKKQASFLTRLLSKLKPAVKPVVATPESAIRFQTKLRYGLNNRGFRETGAPDEGPKMFTDARKLEQLRRLKPELANQYNDATAAIFKSDMDTIAQQAGFGKRANDMWDTLLDGYRI